MGKSKKAAAKFTSWMWIFLLSGAVGTLLLSLSIIMINFKFYFGTTKFYMDKANLNLKNRANFAEAA